MRGGSLVDVRSLQRTRKSIGRAKMKKKKIVNPRVLGGKTVMVGEIFEEEKG